MHTALIVGGIILGVIAVAAIAITVTVIVITGNIAIAVMKGLGY